MEKVLIIKIPLRTTSTQENGRLTSLKLYIWFICTAFFHNFCWSASILTFMKKKSFQHFRTIGVRKRKGEYARDCLRSVNGGNLFCYWNFQDQHQEHYWHQWGCYRILLHLPSSCHPPSQVSLFFQREKTSSSWNIGRKLCEIAWRKIKGSVFLDPNASKSSKYWGYSEKSNRKKHSKRKSANRKERKLVKSDCPAISVNIIFPFLLQRD